MGAVVWFLISRMELWLVAAIAYFCGCFNGAVIISKYILRDDVRRHGSGNAGLTNFYRTFGGPLSPQPPRGLRKQIDRCQGQCDHHRRVVPESRAYPSLG